MKHSVLQQSEQAPPASAKRKQVPLKLLLFLLAGGWTLVIIASFFYNTAQLTEHAMDSARIQARTAVEKDVIYRQWNSMHGGVFVPVVPGRFEPNPYLPVEGREIVDKTTGREYTKINPAYMTRLVHELGALRTGVRGHITSTRPIRKGNEPDVWERQALIRLESGEASEVSSLEIINGQKYMRLIRGLETEASCMPCHAHQGYKVGDVRGGISVDVPMAPFIATIQRSQRILLITHAGLWVLGLLGIYLCMRQVENGLRTRDSAEQELRELTAELEQRVQERAIDLKSRQREMQAFVDNANAGVFLKDLDGTYRIANSLFASILELEPEEIVGRKDGEVLPLDLYTRSREAEDIVIKTGVSREVKNGFMSKQGRLYSSFLFPVLEGEKAVGIGGLLVDMSERDKVEGALREARDAAEKASRAKSDFLANMSHEIRTPLNGVIGMADLLLRTRLTPDQASMAAAVKTSGDSLLLVLNDVLDISKIEAGKLNLEQMPFQLRDLLFDSVKGLTPIAYKKSLELILHVSPAVPDHVVGDSVRIRQVILNLVNNALKFTEKGEVVITVLLLSGTEDKARLRFSVTDTGIGIPLEKQQNIFQAFEQVDTSTTRKYGGTGLGLAICSRLLEIMGSKLELKSHEGFGSCFWFELELPIEKDADQQQKPLVCTDALKNLHVLIVDDNDTNLRILNETLSLWGLKVAQARSVDEALALAQVASNASRPFQLILTDLQMPEKDGVDILRLIRANISLAHLPIILLTSGNLPSSVQNEVGKPGFFDSILDKPVRPEMLMRAIASALNIWESYDVQEMKRGEELKAEEDKSKRRLKILLAEDVEMNQMVATRMLKELGHSVTIVGDGQQAIEAIGADRYDMIFMDIQMPVMDGVQATLAIREMEAQGLLKERIPIVAMTANALKGDKAKYLSVGMDGYLAKPILLEGLRNSINEVFYAKETASEEDRPPAKMDISWCSVQEAAKDSVCLEPAPARAPFVAPSARSGPEAPDWGLEKGEDGGTIAFTRRSSFEQGAFADKGLIDWVLLERSFAGNRGFISDSMTLYLRDAPRLLQEVREAMLRMDNGGLTVNAHALKGITGYFTREGAFALCLELEEFGREKALPDKQDDVMARLTELSRQVDLLMAEMEAYIAGE